MNYLTYINTIKATLSGLTYSGTTGQTILNWVEFCLNDEPELNPNTKYPAAFITPMPSTIPASDMNTPFVFNCRVYVVDNIGLDRSLRLQTYNKCIDVIIKLVQEIEEHQNWVGFNYPIQITPIVYYDSNTDGVSAELALVDQYTCPI